MRTIRENWSQIPEVLKTFFWIFVGLFIVIFVIGFLGILGFIPSSDIFGFMSGLLAGIFGILIGFSLDRVSERNKEKQRVATFLELVHGELSHIRKLTPPDITDTGQFYTFYTDIWDSMVSIGILSLLEPEQAVKLSALYKHIKATSVEAEWFRKAWEEYQSIPESEHEKKHDFVGKKLNELGENHLKRLTVLRQQIDDVFKEPWWTVKVA